MSVVKLPGVGQGDENDTHKMKHSSVENYDLDNKSNEDYDLNQVKPAKTINWVKSENSLILQGQ